MAIMAWRMALTGTQRCTIDEDDPLYCSIVVLLELLMASKKRYMDALEGLSDGSLSSSGDSEVGHEQPKKKKKQEVSLEHLERCGYKGSASVLLVPEPKDGIEPELRWSDGRSHRAKETEEDWEDRERTREAATAGAESQADFSKKALKQAEELRKMRKEEQSQLAAEHRLTFKQKEKRKRDADQAKSSKNFVEEEKRLARDFGIYPGFD